MSQLFSSYQLGPLQLDNRIVVSPMCQYSAEDGSATAWHMMHLGTLAQSGAGLVMIEATAVTRDGRITHGCLGLYSDENEAALVPVLAACRRYGHAKIGLQIGHAGRKASSRRPWEGVTMSEPLAPEGEPWPTLAPSAIPIAPHWHVPREMTVVEIAQLKAAFMEATRRAHRLGIDVLEIHAAHGYLLHQFLSPLSNTRDDQYGGNAKNRMRLPLEVVMAVRSVWPSSKPLGVRVSATDWVEGGLNLEDTLMFLREAKSLGCDFVDVSTGGIDPTARIPVGPGYQVPFAAEIKSTLGMSTMAVGMITEPTHAESIVAEGQADLVALARAFIDNPRWGWHAAYALGAEANLPPQHARAHAKVWPPARRHQPQQSTT